MGDPTEENPFPVFMADQISDAAIIAVLVIDDSNDAVPVAQALIDGGVTAIELALRTSAAPTAIEKIVHACPQMIVGAGTVLTVEQVSFVHQNGVNFAVAPGFNARVVNAAKELRLPFAPGISTPSEIEAAVELGCRLLKLFPAEPLGGIQYLKSIHSPYDHLKLQYIPLGGLNEDNALDYLSQPIIHSLGGSWIAPRRLIQSRDWQQITRNAAAAMQIVEQASASSSARRPT